MEPISISIAGLVASEAVQMLIHRMGYEDELLDNVLGNIVEHFTK